MTAMKIIPRNTRKVGPRKHGRVGVQTGTRNPLPLMAAARAAAPKPMVQPPANSNEEGAETTDTTRMFGGNPRKVKKSLMSAAK